MEKGRLNSVPLFTPQEAEWRYLKLLESKSGVYLFMPLIKVPLVGESKRILKRTLRERRHFRWNLLQIILGSMMIYQVIPSSKLTADWLQISLAANLPEIQQEKKHLHVIHYGFSIAVRFDWVRFDWRISPLNLNISRSKTLGSLLAWLGDTSLGCYEWLWMLSVVGIILWFQLNPKGILSDFLSMDGFYSRFLLEET